MTTPTTPVTPTTDKRSRRRPAVITVGALGTAALALSMSGTLSAFTASITNSTNTGGLGSLVMRETNGDGSISCTTSPDQTSMTCSDINKYGGNLAMSTGVPVTTSIKIANDGATPASSFSLTPGACTVAKTITTASGDLCTVALVTVKQDGVTVIDRQTPAAIASAGNYVLTPVTAGGSSSLDITFEIPDSAPSNVQGESVSQPLTWTFNA